MALIPDAAKDAALAYIRTNGTQLSLCSSRPANYAGIAAVELARAPVTLGATVDGPVSGRAITVPALTADPIDATGTATWQVVHDALGIIATDTELVAPLNVDASGSYNSPAWLVIIPDAVAD